MILGTSVLGKFELSVFGTGEASDDTANERSGRHLSLAVSVGIWMYYGAEHVMVKVEANTELQL